MTHPHVPTSNGVASSDEITRCITGSAAAPPRFARDRGRYCRLLSGHPPGETSRVFKHMFLQVTLVLMVEFTIMSEQVCLKLSANVESNIEE